MAWREGVFSPILDVGPVAQLAMPHGESVRWLVDIVSVYFTVDGELTGVLVNNCVIVQP